MFCHDILVQSYKWQWMHFLVQMFPLKPLFADCLTTPPSAVEMASMQRLSRRNSVAGVMPVDVYSYGPVNLGPI